MQITAAMLKAIAPSAKSSIAEGAAAVFSEWFPRLAITGERRPSHFLAQNAHESDGFKTTVEYASGQAYEGRRDLGNTQPGDGRRYKGRGLIQCTGRHNYGRFTVWMKKHDPDAPDFVERPELLAEFPWAALSALWYWAENGLNALADRDDHLAVTYRINGGYNGLADRSNYLRRARAVVAKGAPSAQPIAPTLRKGIVAYEAEIRALQANLCRLGYPLIVDGDFGKKTEEKVKAFQRANGLTADGIVGPNTHAAIAAALSRLT